MRIALLHQHYDDDKIQHVKANMQQLGAPKIKAVYMPVWDLWVALEGCHRLRAAHDLGITPVIEAIEYSDNTLYSLGIEDCRDDTVTVAEIAGTGYDCEILEFNE